MPETNEAIDAAVETLPKVVTLQFGTTSVVAIAALATYGAVSATRDITAKAKQIRETRKTKKAVKKALESEDTATS